MPAPNPHRFLRALSQPESGLDHAACQAALSGYLAVEMADGDPAEAFPEVQAHLDRCEICSELHALMLDEALRLDPADARAIVPDLILPWPVRLRQWAQSLAGGALQGLRQSQSELEGTADAFFEALARAQGPLTLQDSSLAFGLGATRSEALPLVMTAYYSLEEVAATRPTPPLRLEQMASAEPDRSRLVQTLRAQAARVGLGGPATAALVQAVLQSVEGADRGNPPTD